MLNRILENLSDTKKYINKLKWNPNEWFVKLTNLPCISAPTPALTSACCSPPPHRLLEVLFRKHHETEILKRWRLGPNYFRPEWTPNPHYIKLRRTKNNTKTAYICRNWIAWKSSLNWRQWRNDSQKCKCYLTQNRPSELK